MKPSYARAGRSLPVALMFFAGLMLAGAGAQADARHYGKWKSVQVKLLKLKAHKIKHHRNHKARMSDLEDRVDALEAGGGPDISALEARVASLEADVLDLQAGLANLDDVPARLAVLEADVADLNAALDGLGGDVSNLQTRVDSLEASLAALAALEVRVAALEAGGGGGGGLTDFFIDCTAGDLISDALATGDPGLPLTITVSGNCAERVVIRRDDVTVQGANVGPVPLGGSVGDPLDELVGDIRIDASSRVTIRDLSIVNGPDTGVLADRGSSVELFNLRINGHAGAGIGISKNSFAQITNVTAINPPTGFNAVFLNDGGDARIRDSVLISQAPTFDDGAALGLFRSAHARFDGNNVIQNTNSNPDFNQALAIQVLHTSNLRIQNPGSTGNQIIGNVLVANNSDVDIREGIIFGQTGVSSQSRLRIRNTPVMFGSVALFRMSVLQSDGSLPASVICLNGQSMVTGSDVVAGTGAGSLCTLE